MRIHLAVKKICLFFDQSHHRRRIIQPAAAAPVAGIAPNLMAMASDLAGDAVKADPLGAMLGAGAAGFILETRPDLDHALIQQVLRQFLNRS